MKERISATIEKETRKRVEKLLKSGKYRNISHLVESAIKILEDKNAK